MAKVYEDSTKNSHLTISPNFILPEQVEEEAKIIKIECYKLSKSKTVLTVILTLITAGFLALLLKWKYYLRVALLYRNATPKDADFLLIYGLDGTIDHISVKSKDIHIAESRGNYKAFVYRLYTFYLDESDEIYKPVQFIIKNKTYQNIHQDMGNGIVSLEQYERTLLNYGLNSTNIPGKSNFIILIDEILSPFYMFQIFSVIFWGFFNDYVIYAAFIFGLSLITLGQSFYKIKMNDKKLRKRAYYETEIKAYRSFSQERNQKNAGEAQTISSIQLVPGDLIEVPSNKKLPCDVILLTGLCIMNESMLTGESIPVIKQQLPKTDKIFDSNSADLHILFSGTECLETRQTSPNTPVLGLVLRTSFDTMKGRLVRSFLYSKPENFQFYKDSLKYIGAMAVIAVICFAFSVKTFIDQGQDIGYIIKKSLDIITIAVPPALPTCVAIGASIATARLEKKSILTKSELKINVAGRVKFMCFDKTGTLTQDSLDLHGVRLVSKTETESNLAKFQSLVSEDINNKLNCVNAKTLSYKMLELMASCHSLTYIKGAISGDPLDLRMFEATGWSLKENNGTLTTSVLCSLSPPSNTQATQSYQPSSEISVVKRFEFSPKLQRMSVIVRDPSEEKLRVYVKGSPEVIATLCESKTLPEDFNKVLLSYTQSGLRVIACGSKLLDKDIQSQDHLERENFENGLEFLGFLIFENKMKKVTPLIISRLKNADIRTIMLTGDNPLTAIFVAKDCGIVDKGQNVILGTLESSEEGTSNRHISWKYIGITQPDQDPEESTPKSSNSQNQVAIEMIQPVDKLFGQENKSMSEKILVDLIQKYHNVAISMTGEAYNYLDSSSEFQPVLKETILRKTKVFARMRPDDKALIIEKLQSQGYIVGMCGDGANDCPALKAANVGVALSEAEASLAAPFMSKIINISCVDILLREGRTALVTSFQCFKYMSMYSLIQTFSVVILYSRSSALTDPSFLYQDLFVIIPAAFTMALTLPTKKLSKQQPAGSLLSVPILTAMIGQCIIQAIAQYVAVIILQRQEWYVNPETLVEEAIEETGDEEATAPDYDSTVLFLVGNIQYFATVMAFSIGKPFRKPFYTNWVFTSIAIITTAISIILILVPLPKILDLLDLKNFEADQSFRWIIFAIVAINTAVTICFEKFLVPLIFFFSKKARREAEA